MAKHSDIVNWNSPDGLPSNPWPMVPIKCNCKECYQRIDVEICPYCGTENELEYEPDYGREEEE